MQHKLNEGPLLDDKGYLIEAGYHTSLVKSYDRKSIKVKGMRIKEWDYYFIGDKEKGIAFTVADNSYMWLTSLTFFDFTKPSETSKTFMGWFPMGKLNFPSTSKEGDIAFSKKGFSFSFVIKDQVRVLKVSVDKFDLGPLEAEIRLTPTIKDSMVIATPFHKPKHFYYNQKINLLKAEGMVKIGDKTYDFNEAYGVLDWGRGVWTYKNTWYWSSMSGVQDGVKIGFNLGYGFGDTSKASENMLFVDQNTYKLADVNFEIPFKDGKEDFMSPWRFTSKDKSIDLTFTPIIDRMSNSNVLIIKSIQHQVFGKFSGTFTVEKNKKIVIKEMLGFAEKVINHW